MKLFDYDYFKRLLMNPKSGYEEAAAIKIRLDLADKTNTMLIFGGVLILCSQALLSALLPVSIALSLFGALLILAAGWLQLTFTKRSKNGEE